MSALITQPNVAHPDDVYEVLIQLHDGLSDEESRLVNAKLILLLVNHIGDEQAIREALAAARRQVTAFSQARLP